MSPERIAKKKKAVKKQNLTVVEKVALRNPILRKRRILASLWARLEKLKRGCRSLWKRPWKYPGSPGGGGSGCPCSLN